ncbi:MAG: hypothetical protein GY918_04865 [Gammaproteobacteria bacterium]|nr:hypothetical protein [Gammaproteobacteria bacterium]
MDLTSNVIIPVGLDDGSDHEVTTTIYQLIQWKHALKLEQEGLTMSGGRSVTAHVRQFLFGKRKGSPNRKTLYAIICTVLKEVTEQAEQANQEVTCYTEDS